MSKYISIISNPDLPSHGKQKFIALCLFLILVPKTNLHSLTFVIAIYLFFVFPSLF